MRTFAMVPAAGLSRRMGVQKLSLRLGDRTVLEHVLAALREVPVDRTIVVLGPRSRNLAELVVPPARTLILERDTSHMRETVEAGLDWLEAHETPTGEDAFVLALADQPTLRAETVRALIAQRQRNREAIIVPLVNDRRGHPALFPWSFRNKIRELPENEGINSLMKGGAVATLLVPFDDPGLLEDMDEPEDYERLRRRPWNDT